MTRNVFFKNMAKGNEGIKWMGSPTNTLHFTIASRFIG